MGVGGGTGEKERERKREREREGCEGDFHASQEALSTGCVLSFCLAAAQHLRAFPVFVLEERPTPLMGAAWRVEECTALHPGMRAE